MSVYHERFEVHYGFASYYTSDPKKALEILNDNADLDNLWVNEGWGYESEDNDGRHMVTRRTTGPVSKATLEFLVQRKVVLDMLEGMKS